MVTMVEDDDIDFGGDDDDDTIPNATVRIVVHVTYIVRCIAIGTIRLWMYLGSNQ
jgi:hypothetical protein